MKHQLPLSDAMTTIRNVAVNVLVLILCIGLTQTFHGYQRDWDSTQCFQIETLSGECNAQERFRRLNGQCNNLDNPLWGSASTVLVRVLPSAYQDNVSSPRENGSDGEPLPSARNVSVNCHPQRNVTSDVTMMIVHWGQFLDHDITLTAKPSNNCTCDSASTECFPIPISNDDFFTQRECFEFIRSTGISATDSQHSSPVRQQTNLLTAYIDASNVYGSTEEEHEAVREPHSFKLKVSKAGSSGNDFLPENPNPDGCSPVEGEFCFLAGDERSNEQPGLTAIHTLFVREHNRIATWLHSKTKWRTERIFQETRKIIGAMVQRISFNEFLPIVIGPQNIVLFGLDLSDNFQYYDYVRPDIMNAFATAAFRFAHSLIPEELDLSLSSSLELRDVFSNPHSVLTSFNELFSGGAAQNSSGNDRFFSHSVSRHLFETENGNGFDLISLNIQRGRDHGLPPYNRYREWCSLSPLTSLDELFPGDSVAASTYRSIEDVDLFTGGIAEEPVEGGLVGPTFSCIIASQFQQLQQGDRFFYLNKDGPARFTQSQRAQINRITLSKVICENSELESIQKYIFLPEDPVTNPSTPCKDLPSLNLTPWIPRFRYFHYHR